MTGEQRLLLHKAAENLRATRLLADQKLYDIAISRAYYVMFYVAEAILLGEGLAFSKRLRYSFTFHQRRGQRTD